MVSNRHGGSNLGCLVSLLLFVAALYYGVHIGEAYVRFYRLQDEMRSQARLAPSLTDQVIRRRLLDEIDDLGLPSEAQRLTIRRSARPRTITIECRYAETLELPFFRHTFQFHPHVEQPL